MSSEKTALLIAIFYFWWRTWTDFVPYAVAWCAWKDNQKMNSQPKPKPRPRGRGKWRLCPACGGIGFKPTPRKAVEIDGTPGTVTGPEKCKTCNGKGWIGT